MLSAPKSKDWVHMIVDSNPAGHEKSADTSASRARLQDETSFSAVAHAPRLVFRPDAVSLNTRQGAQLLDYAALAPTVPARPYPLLMAPNFICSMPQCPDPVSQVERPGDHQANHFKNLALRSRQAEVVAP